MTFRFYVLLICFIYAALAAFCMFLLWFAVGHELWLSAFTNALITVYAVHQIHRVLTKDHRPAMPKTDWFSTNHYILVGQLAVPEPDWLKWAQWYNDTDRHVAETIIGPIVISTVFLGVDHAHGRGLPILFETMIFRGGDGHEIYRYASWQEAEAGHAAAVVKVRAEIKEQAR